jgi:hypothetical protein
MAVDAALVPHHPDADTALLRRIGHLHGSLPGVDAAFATRSQILDYF